MVFTQWTDTAFNELEILPQEISFGIIRQVDFLARFPEMGASLEIRFPVLKGFQQLVIKRNIRVIYEFDYEKETVFILAVQNCRQKLLSLRDLKRRQRQVD